MGRNLVSRRAGSIPEVSGPWGSLAVTQDPAELAMRLEMALRQARPWSDRSRQRESMRARFSWGRTVQRFRDLYFPVRISKVARTSGHLLGVG